MSASTAPRTAVSWDEYAALPDDAHVEYIDGQLVANPSPTGEHQDLCVALLLLLRPLLPPGWKVRLGWAWKPGSDEFIPDVMVHPVTDETARFTGTPALCVEVLSGRGDDLVVKATRYAAAGLPAYWIIDPRDRELLAFTLHGGVYRQVARLAVDPAPAQRHTTTDDLDLALGSSSVTVHVDLADLFGQ